MFFLLVLARKQKNLRFGSISRFVCVFFLACWHKKSLLLLQFSYLRCQDFLDMVWAFFFFSNLTRLWYNYFWNPEPNFWPQTPWKCPFGFIIMDGFDGLLEVFYISMESVWIFFSCVHLKVGCSPHLWTSPLFHPGPGHIACQVTLSATLQVTDGMLQPEY